MIASKLQGMLYRTSWNKMTTKKKHFTLCESSGEVFYEVPIMAWLMLKKCNPDTKVGVQVLRKKIQSAKSHAFQHSMPMILEHTKT